MNQTLAAGDERNGRPLLGGIGSVEGGSSSARGGAGLPFVAIAETFARVASVVTGGGGGGLTEEDPGGGRLPD